ncbi:MAG: hypothetical protein A2Y97_13015 [Nitrospirae bacterium RBG_13_39_12]|nr:MAG: hypothetical protein A2Y97_13015 [Nitrospirae bacterium RBG_13_39_12]
MNIKTNLLLLIVVGLTLIVSAQFIAALDGPHNESNIMNCGDCHGETLLNSPFWNNSDDYAHLCQRCHTGIPIPYAAPHANRQCRDCHNPHYQRQKMYKNTDAGNLYLATGTITSCVYNPPVFPDVVGKSTLTYDPLLFTYKSGWDAAKLIDKTEKGGSDKRSAVSLPNVRKLGYIYPIVAVDTPAPNTITVKGNACANLSAPPTTFAAMYGQYIRDSIDVSTDRSGTYSQVKFFDKKGQGSFAYDEDATPGPDPTPDVDPTPNGVCQVCHTDLANPTNPSYWRADGTGADHHNNYPDGCIFCHTHAEGFAHGGGGDGCEDCHGHENDWSGGLYHGTTASHSTHTENDSDDLKGPYMACSGCHDTDNYPKFSDGNNLSATNVCDTCHSPNGSFNGINSTGTSIGAKNYWKEAIYPDLTSKEKWCAGCHDNVPAVIDSNTAPDIVGDNTTYGYYLNTHGNATDGVKRTSISYARGECLHCHDVTLVRTSHGVPLFDTVFVDQNTGFCFNCHTASGESLQTSMPNQYNYSYSQGGSTVTCPDNIRLAFSGEGYIHVFNDPTDWTLSGCTISLVSSDYVLLCATNPPDKYADNNNAKLQTGADFVLKVKTHDNNIAQTEGPEIRVFLQGDSNSIDFDIYSSSIRIRYVGTDRATTAITRQADTYLRVSRIGTTYYFQAFSDAVYTNQITDEISWDYGTSRNVDKIRLLTSGCTSSIYYDNFLFFYFDPGPPCDPNQGWFSSHYLSDVRDSLQGNWGWGDVVEYIDPCSGCHNPHRTTRDYPASLADGHANPSTWEVWGDETGEKMADYVSSLGPTYIYQPPYKAGGDYERDADTQPDYNTLCLKCHSSSHTSTPHGVVNAVNWSTSYHGKGAASDGSFGNLKLPYDEANRGKYVLCCTDCHEPHGSTNSFLLRKTVNGVSALPAGDGSSVAGGRFYYWCSACHDLTEHVMAFPQYRCGDAMGCHLYKSGAGKNHSYWF